MKNKKLASFLMVAQAVELLAAIIFGIVSIFSNEFFIAFKILLLLQFLILIINNTVIYKRKNMTIYYIATLLVMLVMFF